MKKRVFATVLACAMAFHFLSPVEQAHPEEAIGDHSIDRVTGNSTTPYYGAERQSTATLSSNSWAEIASLSLAEQLALSQIMPISGDAVILGSKDTPFLLSNVAQLQELATYVNNEDGDFNAAYYRLTNDVSLSSVESWTAIGKTGTISFQGSFDGDGHIISDMTITSSAGRQGLFGYTRGASIENLGLLNCDVTGDDSVGGLVGLADGTTIENCYTTGAVEGTLTYYSNVGGLVGQLRNSSIIQNCYATGDVSGTSSVGGLVGHLTNPGLSIVNSVALNPSVTGTGSFVNRVVGLDSSISTTLTNNYAWDGMTVKNSTVISTDAASAHGEDLPYNTTDGLGTQFSAIFQGDKSAWEFTNNKLPTLKDVGGNQSSEIPYYMTGEPPSDISTVSELQALAAYVNAGNTCSGKIYTLQNDLDLSGVEWIPIGNYTTQFKGTFDGNNKVISNLTIDKSTSDYQGLFGYTNGATIQKLGIENCDVSGDNFVGALVGSAYATTIDKCYFTGAVSGTSWYVGGLVGRTSKSTTISNCYSTGTVLGGTYVGGLVGELVDSDMENCYTTGLVTGSGAEAGGLVGRFHINSNTHSIQNCYATGAVSGGGSNVGGLVGHLTNPGLSIVNSVALNSSISGNSAVNRVAGQSGGTLTNNYAWKDMLVNNVTVTGAVNDQNGENLSVKDGFFVKLNGDSIYDVTTIFDTNIWNIPSATDGDYMLLPTLIGVGNDAPSIYLVQTILSEVMVSFNVDGGSTVPSQETVGNKLTSLPTTTKTDYVFGGW